MILDQLPVSRVNARKTDAFDIYNSRFYEGSNPYLNTAAIAFDFALTGNIAPLPIETYIAAVGDRYPHLKEHTYESYAHLFAQVAAAVNQLDVGLHLHKWSVTQRGVSRSDPSGSRCCLAGDRVDVTSPLLETYFPIETSARIPIMTFNRVSMRDLQELVDHLLGQYPHWVIGAVCREGVLINRSEKVLHPTYNVNVSNLLRNPRLDMLIAEYRSEIFEQDGMFYSGSDMVVLDNPTETETLLTRDVFPHSTVVVRESGNVSIRRQGLIEQYRLGGSEPFSRVYLKETGTILG